VDYKINIFVHAVFIALLMHSGLLSLGVAGAVVAKNFVSGSFSQ